MAVAVVQEVVITNNDDMMIDDQKSKLSPGGFLILFVSAYVYNMIF